MTERSPLLDILRHELRIRNATESWRFISQKTGIDHATLSKFARGKRRGLNAENTLSLWKYLREISRI